MHESGVKSRQKKWASWHTRIISESAPTAEKYLIGLEQWVAWEERKRQMGADAWREQGGALRRRKNAQDCIKLPSKPVMTAFIDTAGASLTPIMDIIRRNDRATAVIERNYQSCPSWRRVYSFPCRLSFETFCVLFATFASIPVTYCFINFIYASSQQYCRRISAPRGLHSRHARPPL